MYAKIMLFNIKKYNSLIFICLQIIFGFTNIFAQNNSLVLNGAFIKLNNGSFSNPVYLVVNSGQPTAITRNSGHIISEKEGNYVQLNTADVNSNTDFVIPFGYSNTDYLPVTIHKNSVGSGVGHVNNASPIVASTWGTPANNVDWAHSVTNMTSTLGADVFGSVIDRWWQVFANLNVSATFDITYRGTENTTTSSGGVFQGQQFDIPTDQWIVPSGFGTGVTTGTGTVTNINIVPHGLNTSSPYVLSSSISPLPIDLISFTANCNENVRNIKWTTASEINVVNIELQKSYDLSVWTTIYTAMPSNQSVFTDYSFDYNETKNEVVYYRLKTNNNDGNFDITKEIALEPCGIKSDLITAFSEGNIIHVNSFFKSDSKVNYSIYDIQGKIIKTGEYNSNAGWNQYLISLDNISTAIYIFRAESSTTMCNQKVLISNL